MARGNQPMTAGPVVLFCGKLRRLWEASGVKQASLAKAANRSTTQVSDILNGNIRGAPAWEVVEAIVGACLAHAQRSGRPIPPDLGDLEDWRRRYFDLEQDLDTKAQSSAREPVSMPSQAPPPGRLLSELADPFGLDIHRAIGSTRVRAGRDAYVAGRD